MWFKFGFILNIWSLSVAVLQIVHFITESKLIGYFWQFIACPLSCGALAWWITGMVFRWRHYGKVCSGEYYDDDNILEGNVYMEKSGKFMQIYFILVFCMCCLGCCAACCTVGAMSAMGARQANTAEAD